MPQAESGSTLHVFKKKSTEAETEATTALRGKTVSPVLYRYAVKYVLVTPLWMEFIWALGVELSLQAFKEGTLWDTITISSAPKIM